uniref:Uncharacterized protein n=1 Tax=Vitis vinifera TaxID=29760 RepID=A5B540_VITVI|nr:hypothetical protein VITISV_030157 [Vitis vinifera]
MAWMGWCSRPMRGEDHQYLLQNRLPRGPVPPSGPSPCHHKFSPVSQSGASYTDDSIKFELTLDFLAAREGSHFSASSGIQSHCLNADFMTDIYDRKSISPLTPTHRRVTWSQGRQRLVKSHTCKETGNNCDETRS